MRSRHTIPVLFALLALPAVASAGPIQFDLVPTDLYVAPGSYCPGCVNAFQLVWYEMSIGPAEATAGRARMVNRTRVVCRERIGRSW